MPKNQISMNPEIESQITRLLAKRMRYWKKVILIDIEINRIVLCGGAPSEEMLVAQEVIAEDGERNEKTLDFYVYDLLAETPMTLKDLVSEILRTGYKTRSKNFSTVVQQVIQRLSKASAIKRDPVTREYSSIAVSPNMLKQRLSQQNRSKRQSRMEKTDP